VCGDRGHRPALDLGDEVQVKLGLVVPHAARDVLAGLWQRGAGEGQMEGRMRRTEKRSDGKEEIEWEGHARKTARQGKERTTGPGRAEQREAKHGTTQGRGWGVG
jgi:hypothetical protein